MDTNERCSWSLWRMPNVNYGLLTIPRDQWTFQSDRRRKLSGMDEEGAPNTGEPTEQVLPRGWPRVVRVTKGGRLPDSSHALQLWPAATSSFTDSTPSFHLSCYYITFSLLKDDAPLAGSALVESISEFLWVCLFLGTEKSISALITLFFFCDKTLWPRRHLI